MQARLQSLEPPSVRPTRCCACHVTHDGSNSLRPCVLKAKPKIGLFGLPISSCASLRTSVVFQHHTCLMRCSRAWMSALPLKADKSRTCRHVRLVPITTECNAAKKRCYLIASSARTSSVGGTPRPSAFASLRKCQQQNPATVAPWRGFCARYAEEASIRATPFR